MIIIQTEELKIFKINIQGCFRRIKLFYYPFFIIQ